MSDVMELEFAALLDEFKISYSRPDQTKGGGRLDFYLPEFRLYVEVKTYECPRLLDQIKSVNGETFLSFVGCTVFPRFAVSLWLFKPRLRNFSTVDSGHFLERLWPPAGSRGSRVRSG
jgi:hypothetical protein